jgi:hypothetical protein
MQSCDRNRRSKEICQVREKTCEEKELVRGIRNGRTGEHNIGCRVMIGSRLNFR